MPRDMNHVDLIGRLTRDPELKTFDGGGTVCSIRLANNSQRKNGQTGEWEDESNFFDITIWGAQGENCHKYLSKGRQIAIAGRLRWREFRRQDGSKGQAVDIVAESVQFLGGRQDSADNSAQTDGPTDPADFASAPPAAAASEDDIPF